MVEAGFHMPLGYPMLYLRMRLPCLLDYFHVTSYLAPVAETVILLHEIKEFIIEQ